MSFSRQTGWAGIPRERVAAVFAEDAGETKLSSGFLVGPGVVLTAAHGLPLGVPKVTAAEIDVAVAGRTARATQTLLFPGLDAALLKVRDSAFDQACPPVLWGRLDRSAGGLTVQAEAVGCPLWQRQAGGERNPHRDFADIKGPIRSLEGVGSGLLTIRDWELATVNIGKDADADEVAWSGMSGAAVFTTNGYMVGIVIEYRPRDGASALRILPVTALAGAVDDLSVASAQAAGIPPRPGLPGHTRTRTGHW